MLISRKNRGLIPGIYAVTEANPGAEWIVTGEGDISVTTYDVCGDKTKTITNTYNPGCLLVEKIIDLNGAINLDGIDETFVITVTGESYPSGQDLTFNVVDGAITSTNPQELSGLIPGIYTVTESAPTGWIATGEGDITIAAGDECGSKTKTITNHLGRIYFEKYDGSTDLLLGGTTFLIESQTTSWSITVVDNGPNDYDPRDGIFEILFIPLDNHPDPTCFTVTEIEAPPGYDISEPQTICLEAGIEGETLVFINYPLGGCSYTPGYWKTHSKYGPAPYDDVWALLPDFDGTGAPGAEDEIFFDNDEDLTWYSIMGFSAKEAKELHVKWNKVQTYQHLAFHYVAAYLNSINPENGALPAGIAGYMAEAEYIFEHNKSMEIPKKLQAYATEITSYLAEFNEGCYDFNWPHCDDIGTLIVYKGEVREDVYMSGWEFEIYSQNCEKSITKTTTGEGYFEIELMAGDYDIEEIIPTGFDNWYLYQIIIYEDGELFDTLEYPISCSCLEDLTIKSGVITSVVFYNIENEPPVAVDNTYNVMQSYSFGTNSPGLLFNDNDPDGDPITIISNTDPLPTAGTLDNINPDGSFQFYPYLYPASTFLGDATFTYTISDPYGLTDTATVTLHYHMKPIADFTWNTPVIGGITLVTLDASSSSDPDGTIVNWEWDIGNDGYDYESTISPTQDYTFPTVTTITQIPVKLRVRDNLLGNAQIIKDITVLPIP